MERAIKNLIHTLLWASMAVGILLPGGCQDSKLGPLDFKGKAPFTGPVLVKPAFVNIDSLTPTNGYYTLNAKISALVLHPDGEQNIKEADYVILAPGSTAIKASGSLFRAGGSDSTYSANVSFTLTRSEVGNYVIEVKSLDITGVPGNAVQTTLVVSKNSGPPLLGTPGARQTSPGGTIPATFLLSVAVYDSNGIGAIDSVTVQAINATDTSSHPLFDNGSPANGDFMIGDGVFSTYFTVTPTANLQEVIFEFNAYDHGLKSNPVRRSLRNHPPQILNVDVPTTIQRPSSGSVLYTFHVTVADSDGLADIDSVYFRNLDATNPANFLMYDDGDFADHGDVLAGDGIYSLIVAITPGVPTGQKRFHFYVVDKAGARDEVERIITIQ